jgi:hypothetical protein
LCAQIVGIPLPAAGVEQAHTATGNHQIELVASHVAAGVRHLDDHLFALDQLGTDVVGVGVAGARELDAEATTAVGIGLGDMPVRQAIRDGAWGVVVASERAATRTGAAVVPGLCDAILAALVAAGHGASGLAAVPVARGEPIAA